MELRHLEQIVEICRQGSFSAAARKLGVAQPTLSKSIARLEAGLCLKLFERDGGAARPTSFGEFLAGRAERMLRDASVLSRDLEQLMIREDGRLRIGFGPVPRIRLMDGVVERVFQAFPDLQLEVRQGDGHSLTGAVNDGRFDLVFCYAERASREFGDLIRCKIFEDEHVAAVRPGHPALRLGPLGPAELLAYPVSSTGPIESFADWLGAITPEQIARTTAFVCDDVELVKRRVRDVDYVARLPRFALEPVLSTGALVELPLTWRARYECWMLVTEARWRSPIVKAVADLARAVAAAGRERRAAR
jgi:DNA-binding transcriptional LysR family regulator